LPNAKKLTFKGKNPLENSTQCGVFLPWFNEMNLGIGLNCLNESIYGPQNASSCHMRKYESTI
jgi:hypothetical protein